MEIIVSDYGAMIGKKSERIVVRQNGQVVAEEPLFKVTHVVISSPGVAISSDAIRECALAGIPISFLSGTGKPLARLSSPEMTGTVQTRRQQILAFLDGRGIQFAQAIARAKISNQAVILKYFAKSRKTSKPDLYRHIRHQVKRIQATRAGLDQPEITGAGCIDEVRLKILSIEGRAGHLYWQVIAELLPADVNFTGREHRGAQDLTNTLLNYGYGILYSQVWGAAVLAGLDPFAGFLHVDRPGKPSLVLDLVEEVRQMVVDRVVFSLLIKGVRYQLNDDHRLTDKSRRAFAERIVGRLDGLVRYGRKRERLRAVIQKQARRLACFFRRERDYAGFVGTW